MNFFLKLVDRTSLKSLGIVAGLMALLPVSPAPHLVEKLGMLMEGTLTRPIDIFDLFMHGGPLLLFAFKFARVRYLKKAARG